MRGKHSRFLMCLSRGLLLTAAVADASAGELAVVSVQPAARSLTAPLDGPLVVQFDRPVQRSSIVAGRDFWGFGRWSGTVSGPLSFSDGDRTVQLTPARPLAAGESVTVILSHDIEAVDGSRLRAAGYSYQFWTRARPAEMDFAQISQMSTRLSEDEGTRPYGGVASDLDGDGALDLAIVNEDSSDLRVFMNRADGTGMVRDFLRPPSPLGGRSSPSEPTDFNRDGIVDLCTANFGSNSVSILLGRGDGTFEPKQDVGVGQQPHGIAVLDADGDGDVDIATADTISDTVSLLLNDGNGIFGAPGSFGNVGAGPWPLAAGDMNNDGILDLVVGARTSNQIFVYAGQGNASFTQASVQAAGGGSIWMIVLGDVNGDGNEDVSAVVRAAAKGAILLGDGQGMLGSPTLYDVAFNPIATDLGDLDGDGDLDWLTSSGGGAEWYLFENDGAAAFTLVERFLAQAAASCALFVDLDGDRDLDLALIDEIDDLLLILQNGGRQGVVPVEPELQVNTATAADQSRPAVCGGAAGFVVTWTAPDPDSGGVFGQRYDPSVAPLGTEFRINTSTTSEQSDPALHCDAAGGFVAVWTSQGQDGDGLGVFGQRYDSAGQAAGGEFRVNTFSAGDQAFPTAAGDDDGNFLVLWESLGQDGDHAGVFGQRFASTGEPAGSEFRVNIQTAQAQVEPAADFDADGGFRVLWQSQAAGDWDILGRVYDSSGAARGGEFQVNAYTTGDQTLPAIVAEAGGGFVALWTAEGLAGSGLDVFGRRFDGESAFVGGLFRVNTYTSGDQQRPVVARADDGGFFVTWQGESQDDEESGVFGRIYAPRATHLGGAFPINTHASAAQRFPAVAESDGAFLVVWQSDGQDGSGLGVFGQRFGRTPAPTAGSVPAHGFAALFVALAGAAFAAAALLRRSGR